MRFFSPATCGHCTFVGRLLFIRGKTHAVFMGEINEETNRSNEGRPCATHYFANMCYFLRSTGYTPFRSYNSEACSTLWCNPASLRSSSHERPFIKSIGLAVPSAAPMPNHSATTTRLCNYPCLALRQNREKNNAASFVFHLCPRAVDRSGGRHPGQRPAMLRADSACVTALSLHVLFPPSWRCSLSSKPVNSAIASCRCMSFHG